MKFSIGQRVRKIRFHPMGVMVVPIGTIGTISTDLGDEACADGCYGVAFDGYQSPHFTGEWSCLPMQLEPIDEDADYKRFMERVMKPVDLGRPVSA